MTQPNSEFGAPPPPNDPHTDETRPTVEPDPEVSESEPVEDLPWLS